MAYFYFKAIHFVGLVSWFTGLFYLVRLFVYHAEAYDKSELEQSVLLPQYSLMENRLYSIIATPAMVLTFIGGFGMIYMNPAVFQTWLHIKLLFVFGLVIYHFYNKRIIKQFELGVCKWKSDQLRMWNEVATLFLVSIVLLAVFKNTLQFIQAFLILFALLIFLVVATRMYKKHRLKKGQ